jgi:hypothetical protein
VLYTAAFFFSSFGGVVTFINVFPFFKDRIQKPGSYITSVISYISPFFSPRHSLRAVYNI